MQIKIKQVKVDSELILDEQVIEIVTDKQKVKLQVQEFESYIWLQYFGPAEVEPNYVTLGKTAVKKYKQKNTSSISLMINTIGKTILT